MGPWVCGITQRRAGPARPWIIKDPHAVDLRGRVGVDGTDFGDKSFREAGAKWNIKGVGWTEPVGEVGVGGA